MLGNNVGVYKATSTTDVLLVGQVPTNHAFKNSNRFIGAAKTNLVIVKPCSKRRREVGHIMDDQNRKKMMTVL